MLQNLLIKNYALIESLEFAPSIHFNIITGETGAGKSIMLGALGLLTGGRADVKALLDTEQKCIVEGIFSIEQYQIQSLFESHEVDYDGITTIRREISPQGKSRSFINDTPVTLDVLKSITDRLLDVHSQHDNLLLGMADFQLQIIDVFAANKHILAAYREEFSIYKSAQKQLDALVAMAGKSKKDYDYEHFLYTELKEAQLQSVELQQLEDELNVLENAEEIKLKLNQSIQLLSEGELSVNSGIGTMASLLTHLSKLSGNYDILRERTLSTLAELKDIQKELERHEEKVEGDPERAQVVRDRLNLLYKLFKKHNVNTVDELLEIQQQLEVKVNTFNSLDAKIADAEQAVANAFGAIKETASKLTLSRKSTFELIESSLKDILADLGMPNNVFKVKIEPTDYTVDGVDKISMLFSANKGIEPTPLKNAASGGEFSRLMFALKYLMAEKSALPTLIFDEIDTGISGEIAMKMGQMMKQISDNHQIIAITHLHQIAAKGDSHFFVFKDESTKGTKTNIRQLSINERLNEIAMMIGGKNPSPTAYESAKELMLLK